MSLGDSNSEVHAPIKMHHNHVARIDKVPDMNLYPDGFYIAELVNPLHKRQRLVVQILKGGFVENPFFCRRSQKDGLKNCYTLLGKVDLDTLVVKTASIFRSN